MAAKRTIGKSAAGPREVRPLARSARSTQGRCVLMLLPGDDHRARDGLDAFRRKAEDRHWDFFSAEVSRAPDGSARLSRSSRSAGTIAELAGLLRPDGIAVWRGALAPDEVRASFGARVPAVFVHRSAHADFPPGERPVTVCWDSSAIAAAAARALLLSGYGDFAYAPAPQDTAWNREREAAFRRCIETAGKACHGFQSPLDRWIASLPKPCGVFAATDVVGEAVLSACAAAGLRVPDDVAVVGVGDNAPLCDATKPSLSSVALDRAVEAESAAALLEGWMRSPSRRPASRTIPPWRVVLRASSRFARDRRVVDALEFIRLHACEEGFAPPAVARRMGVCRTLADRLFRTVLGRTILSEIHGARLARARELLRGGESPAVVAARCGYSSSDVFRHVFRDRMGMTIQRWTLENRV